MVPVALTNGWISISDMYVFAKIWEVTNRIPHDERLTCYAMARIMAAYAPGFRVMDGYFWNGYEHSWLQRTTTIIDPYPVAGGCPMIVTISGLSPWKGLYTQAELDPDCIRTAEQLALETLKELLEH